MKTVHERLYGGSHLLNDAGRYLYYGRVGGCLITGNEDGVKHCAQNVFYTLHRIHSRYEEATVKRCQSPGTPLSS
jgi:multimeric flavodoxin WrbA